MTAAPDMKPSEALRKARELITAREKWTQGDYARDAEKRGVDYFDKNAVCWCSLGAIKFVSPSGLLRSRTEIALERVMTPSVGSFNDEHNHEDVLDAFDRAIALAESEGR